MKHYFPSWSLRILAEELIPLLTFWFLEPRFLTKGERAPYIFTDFRAYRCYQLSLSPWSSWSNSSCLIHYYFSFFFLGHFHSKLMLTYINEGNLLISLKFQCSFVLSKNHRKSIFLISKLTLLVSFMYVWVISMVKGKRRTLLLSIRFFLELHIPK